MSYRLLWSEPALDRASEFFDFIAEENPAAARRVLEDLFDRVQALADQPLLGRRLSEEMDPSLRRLVAGNYVVVYEIDDENRTITIVAVRHFRQRSLTGEEP